jgi:hypothetical protein
MRGHCIIAIVIDPTAITKYDRTHAELEELLLNAITFAGKNARQQAQKMHALFGGQKKSPFALIRGWTKSKTLTKQLKQVRIGKYILLSKSFTELAHSRIDLAVCTVEDLEAFPGIGAKTARLFVLHSRKGQEFAVIDTHMLKEMRALNMTTLRTTPAGKKYSELEKKLVTHLKKNGIEDFAEYDLNVWKKYALRKKSAGELISK